MHRITVSLLGVGILAAGLFAGYQFARAPVALPMAGGETTVEPRAFAPASVEPAVQGGHIARGTPDRAAEIGDRLRALLDISSASGRAAAVEAMFATLDAGQLRVALAEVLGLPPSARRLGVLRGLFGRWGEVDGAGALAAARELDGRERLSLISASLGGWAKVDPRTAWHNAMEIGNDGLMSTVSLRPLLASVTERDPALAVALLGEIPFEPARLGRISYVLDVAADNGTLDSVLAATGALEAGKFKTQLVRELFKRWGRTELDAPLLALGTIRDASLSGEAMNGLLTGWAEVDGAGAFAYVVEHQGDPLVGPALVPVVKEWARSGTSEELAMFMSRMGQTGKFDTIADAVMRDVAVAKPEMAVEWAGMITDDKLREKNLRNAFGIWAATNPADATTHFTSLPEGRGKQQALIGMAGASLHTGQGVAQIAEWVAQVPAEKDRMEFVAAVAGSVRTNRSRLNATAVREMGTALAALPGLSDAVRTRIAREFGLPGPRATP